MRARQSQPRFGLRYPDLRRCRRRAWMENAARLALTTIQQTLGGIAHRARRGHLREDELMMGVSAMTVEIPYPIIKFQPTCINSPSVLAPRANACPVYPLTIGCAAPGIHSDDRCRWAERMDIEVFDPA